MSEDLDHGRDGMRPDRDFNGFVELKVDAARCGVEAESTPSAAVALQIVLEVAQKFTCELGDDLR